MKLERIKNLREDSDMSQAELAKILNISQRTLSHYECGTREIPINLLIKLADYFNCTVDYLVGRSNHKSKDKSFIPKYHPSYTEEENRQLYEQLQNATDDEVVELIQYLWGMYTSDEKVYVDKAMNRLIKDITDRYTLKRKHDLLVKCCNEWKSYREFVLAEFFRRKYNQYKNSGGKLCEEELLFDAFSRNIQEDIKNKGVSNEFVRRSLLKDGSLYGIKKEPKPQTVYSSLDEVAVDKIEPDEALKRLDRKTLENLLVILLQNIDVPVKKNVAPTWITILTAKYSRVSHKKEGESFTTTIPDYHTLRDNCLELLKEIKYYQEEALKNE